MINDIILSRLGMGDADTDQLIDWMARLNNIDHDTAAAEFVYSDTGEIISTLTHTLPANPRGGSVTSWAAARGLTHSEGPQRHFHGLGVGNLAGGIAALLEDNPRRQTLLGHTLARDLNSANRMVDHLRCLAQPRAPRYVGFTVAPYLSTDPEQLVDTADFLRELGLGVRIGRGADAWYSPATLPVVIWNPERLADARAFRSS